MPGADGGSEHKSFTFSSDGSRVFVSNYADATVSIFDASSYALLRSVKTASPLRGPTLPTSVVGGPGWTGTGRGSYPGLTMIAVHADFKLSAVHEVHHADDMPTSPTIH